MKKLLQLLGVLACALLSAKMAQAQAPTFSPAGGSYTSAQSVTITCPSGKTAAYTLDGSQPNIASTKYTSPITISATATLNAICANIQVDNQNTQTSSTGYKCNTPSDRVYGSLTCHASGGVGSIQPSDVSLTWGTTMVYSVSTTASTSETQVLVPVFRGGCDSCTYMAQDFYMKAVGDSSIIANNEVDMVDYNHTYGVNHQIGLQCNQQSGKVGWQIDSDGGTDWVNTGVKEGCPISTGAFTHVALEAHWINGDTSGPHGKGYTYYDALTINGHRYSLVSMGGQPNSATTFGPNIGNQGQIDLTNTVKSGHNPTTGGRQVQLNNVAASIGPPSAVTSASYSIFGTGTAAATPSITPGGGFYSATQTVTIADATPGAAIHYTTDGSTPTSSSATYSTALTVSTTTTVKAIAVASGFVNSAVASAVYTIGSSGGLTATPTFSPGGGTYTATQIVTISDTSSGAVIYYTTDGSTPTTASNVYSVPLSVSATATIKAMAVAPGLTNSSVASATYTITSTLTAATPTFSPGTGNYTATQTVTIADATPSPTIYYTTDGSTPTTSSSIYSTPLSIASTTTVKAIATASGYSMSLVGAATYTIGCGLTPYATGNVDPTQIKASGRQGAGPKFQMAAGSFTAGHQMLYDCNGDAVEGGIPSGSGTVTSVSATVPSRQSVTVSTPTSTPAIAITDNTQSANFFFSGPASGSAAVPTFRAIVAADLPGMVGDTGSGGTKGAVPAPGAGDASAGKFLKADATWAVPAGGTSVYYGQGDAVASTGNNTITLGSTPVSNSSISTYVNGAILRPSTAYTVSGTAITLASSLTSGDVVVSNWVTTNSTPGGIILGTGAVPTLRGTGLAFGTGSSITITLPTGTVAGDTAVLMADSGWSTNTPTGWTAKNTTYAGAGWWSGAVFSKVLSSGDITTGTVTVSFSGNFDCNVGIAVIAGSAYSVLNVAASQNTTPGGTSVSLTTGFGVSSSNLMLYWGSNRATSTDTVSSGTMQQQGTNSGNASAMLYSETGVSGTVARNFLYSTGGDGNFQVIIQIG